jgi:hypothetical protein
MQYFVEICVQLHDIEKNKCLTLLLRVTFFNSVLCVKYSLDVKFAHLICKNL